MRRTFALGLGDVADDDAAETPAHVAGRVVAGLLGEGVVPNLEVDLVVFELEDLVHEGNAVQVF